MLRMSLGTMKVGLSFGAAGPDVWSMISHVPEG